jgi:hypothetical protein
MKEKKFTQIETRKDFFDQFDCIDIGADTNSLAWAKAHLGARKPLGVNIEKTRLDRMREAGDSCVELNAFDIPKDIRPDYVVMGHFLEHLNSRDEVIEMVRRACDWAQKAVFINGPFFEDDDYIRGYGVKFAWGDWIDHVGRYGLSTFFAALSDKIPADRLAVSLGFAVTNSSNDNIFALNEAPNVGSYKTQRTVDKPRIDFPRPAFQEFAVVVAKSQDIDPVALSVARHGKFGMAAWKLLQVEARRELKAIYL